MPQTTELKNSTALLDYSSANGARPDKASETSPVPKESSLVLRARSTSWIQATIVSRSSPAQADFSLLGETMGLEMDSLTLPEELPWIPQGTSTFPTTTTAGLKCSRVIRPF